MALRRSFERKAITTFRFKRDTKLWLVKWYSQKFVGNGSDTIVILFLYRLSLYCALAKVTKTVSQRIKFSLKCSWNINDVNAIFFQCFDKYSCGPAPAPDEYLSVSRWTIHAGSKSSSIFLAIDEFFETTLSNGQGIHAELTVRNIERITCELRLSRCDYIYNLTR